MRSTAAVATTMAALVGLAAALPTNPATVAKRTASAGYPPPPSDLAPGIYEFSFDEFGNPNNTRVGDLDTTPHVAGPVQPLAKRANTYTNCENYMFTEEESVGVAKAWTSMFNEAANNPDGMSSWGPNRVSLCEGS